MRPLPALGLVATAAATALAAADCAPALRPAAVGPGASSSDRSSPAAASGESAVDLAAPVHALAREIERERSAPRRASLAGEAVAAGQRCEQVAPGAPACDYALAIALGLQARERPSTARDGLGQMAARLRRAAVAQPDLDRAGPDRVLALLLLRAPGWPLGPGDPEEGLAAARRCAARFPGHAPNQLALAEALLASGETGAGREAARRALVLAEAAEASGDPDAPGWGREARRLAGGP